MISKTKKIYFLYIITIIFSVYYLLPAGIHIKVCFGDDGHFDISTEICPSNQKLPLTTDSHSKPEKHHENCTDYNASCNDNLFCRAETYILSPDFTSIIKDVHIITAVTNPDVLAQTSINRLPSKGFISNRCNYHPPYLSSVILLV